MLRRRHIIRLAWITAVTSLVCPIRSQTAVEESLLEEAELAEELLERMEKWRWRPIDLNRASLSELQELPLLSPPEAEAVLRERRRGGAFRSLSEAWERMGWDARTRETLSPYLTVSSPPTERREFRLTERYLTRFPRASGYAEGNYEGGPWRSIHRMTCRPSDRFRAGIYIEKDAGERRWNDHRAGYVEAEFPDPRLQIILGQYRVEFGQGLVFWGPYGLTRGADPIAPVKKRPARCRGYASADENHFFSGAAASLRTRKIRFGILISRMHLDATLRPDGDAESLSTAGYHRTAAETTKRHNLQETLLGGRIETSGDWGAVGLSGRISRYSRAFTPGDPERRAFAFRGSRNRVVGLDFDFLLGSASLSGEIAASGSGGWAAVFNAIARVNRIHIALLLRRFTPDYHSPNGRSFGSSAVRNEQGVYFGFRGRITSSTHLSLFCDILRKPWRTYTFPVPSGGTDLFGQLEHRTPRTTWLFRARLRKNDDIRPASGAQRPADVLSVRSHCQMRWECRFRPLSRIDIKSRIETVRITRPGLAGELHAPPYSENGFLAYQDVRARPAPGWTLALRWITFDTGSYESRVYEFESDLPGALTVRPLYGKGIRWYFLIRRDRSPLHLSLKYAATRKEGVVSLGTGAEETAGDTLRELSVQAEIRL